MDGLCASSASAWWNLQEDTKEGGVQASPPLSACKLLGAETEVSAPLKDLVGVKDIREGREEMWLCLPHPGSPMGTSSSGGATRPQNGRREGACSGCEGMEGRGEPCSCHGGFL